MNTIIALVVLAITEAFMPKLVKILTNITTGAAAKTSIAAIQIYDKTKWSVLVYACCLVLCVPFLLVALAYQWSSVIILILGIITILQSVFLMFAANTARTLAATIRGSGTPGWINRAASVTRAISKRVAAYSGSLILFLILMVALGLLQNAAHATLINSWVIFVLASWFLLKSMRLWQSHRYASLVISSVFALILWAAWTPGTFNEMTKVFKNTNRRVTTGVGMFNNHISSTDHISITADEDTHYFECLHCTSKTGTEVIKQGSIGNQGNAPKGTVFISLATTGKIENMAQPADNGLLLIPVRAAKDNDPDKGFEDKTLLLIYDDRVSQTFKPKIHREAPSIQPVANNPPANVVTAPAPAQTKSYTPPQANQPTGLNGCTLAQYVRTEDQRLDEVIYHVTVLANTAGCIDTGVVVTPITYANFGSSQEIGPYMTYVWGEYGNNVFTPRSDLKSIDGTLNWRFQTLGPHEPLAQTGSVPQNIKGRIILPDMSSQTVTGPVEMTFTTCLTNCGV